MDKRDKNFIVMEHLLVSLLVKIELLETEKDVADFLVMENHGLEWEQWQIIERFVWDYFQSTRCVNSGSVLA